MEKFVYIGFIKASGKLDNGKPWEGYRIPVGCFGYDGTVSKVVVLKSPCTDSLYDVLCALQPGTCIACLFDSFGRVVQIDPV